MIEKADLPIVLAEGSEDDGKATLLNLVQQLCEKHQFRAGNRPRTQAVLAMLAAESCERAIRFKVEHGGEHDGTFFDSYYKAKSDLATSFILSSVVSRVSSKGYNVGVALENRDAVGTYDITIQRGAPTLILKGADLLCRLEIKGSWGIPLDEVARFCLNPSPLILCRVMPGTAVLLDPGEQRDFVGFMTSTFTSKAERILHGTPFTVPGPACRRCPDLGCPFNEETSTRRGRVTVREAEFGEDINTFFMNLPHVCERSAQLVLDVLEKRGGQP